MFSDVVNRQLKDVEGNCPSFIESADSKHYMEEQRKIMKTLVHDNRCLPNQRLSEYEARIPIVLQLYLSARTRKAIADHRAAI